MASSEDTVAAVARGLGAGGHSACAEAGAAARTPPADGSAEGAAVADSPVCFQARSVLKLSKGRRKVPLEDLAPSPMNRFGAALSGKQVLSLGQRILRVEGFATYRYIAGWCHEWDADDACAVARDANEKASADPVLPRYPERPLHGVFQCSHLVAVLQLLKAGNTKFPGSTQVMAVPAGPEWEELHDVLAHGVDMEVFSRAALRDHKEASHALMASYKLQQRR